MTGNEDDKDYKHTREDAAQEYAGDGDMWVHQGCATCEFWKFIQYDAHKKYGGFCRRHTPKIIVIDLNQETRFPYTKFDTWCGEYKIDQRIMFRYNATQLRDRILDDFIRTLTTTNERKPYLEMIGKLGISTAFDLEFITDDQIAEFDDSGRCLEKLRAWHPFHPGKPYMYDPLED
jgi:hypothetical protein